jgi:hypothetical protein
LGAESTVRSQNRVDEEGRTDARRLVMLDYLGIVDIFLGLLGHRKGTNLLLSRATPSEGSFPLFARIIAHTIKGAPVIFHNKQILHLVQQFCSVCLEGFQVQFS